MWLEKEHPSLGTAWKAGMGGGSALSLYHVEASLFTLHSHC